MHQRTLEQLKEGVKIVSNGNMNVGNDSINSFRLPQKDGTYILTVSNGGTKVSIKPFGNYTQKPKNNAIITDTTVRDIKQHSKTGTAFPRSSSGS